MNKTVVLDCDGALLDFVTPYIKFIHSLGYTHVSNDIKSFYFLKDYGFAPEQSKNIFKQFVAQGGFRNLKSYPGTIDLFAYLKEAGYKVVLATNVPRMGHQDRINNLKDLGLEYDEIVFGPNKHKVVLDHKASLILEDHPEAIVACHEHTEATEIGRAHV